MKITVLNLSPNSFEVILFKKKIGVGDNVGDNRLQRVLELIIENNQISAKQISEILNVTSRTIERDIEKLKHQNKIKRIGSEKRGYWEVLKNGQNT